MEEFTGEVLGDQEVIKVSMPSKHNTKTKEIMLCQTNSPSMMRQLRKTLEFLKSVIKTRQNFHIYIHGDRKLIQQGQDENGKYYMLYFEEEN